MKSYSNTLFFCAIGLAVFLTAMKSGLACPPPASPQTCLTYCESDTSLDAAIKISNKTIKTQTTKSKEKIVQKIKDLDEANTNAVSAATVADTKAQEFIIKSHSEMMDADNRIEAEMLRQEKMLETIKQIRPTAVDCQNISKNQYVLQGRTLYKAAAKRRVHDNLDAFQQVAGTRTTEGDQRQYSRGATMRALYDDWRTKYCVPTANNGMAGEIEGCGSERAADDVAMEDMDIKIANVLFSPETLPRKEQLDAANSIVYYLGAKQVKTIPVRNYSEIGTQEDLMTFRSIMARKALGDSVFEDLAMKRAPTIPSAIAKELLQADIADNPALQKIVDNIGEKISYAQWSDIMMNKRFIGQDYSTRTSTMDAPAAAKEISSLLTQRLVLQRDRHLMLEKLLGLLAADYSMDIEEASPNTSTVSLGQ